MTNSLLNIRHEMIITQNKTSFTSRSVYFFQLNLKKNFDIQ